MRHLEAPGVHIGWLALVALYGIARRSQVMIPQSEIWRSKLSSAKRSIELEKVNNTKA
jgi:hypothetical protein